MKIKTPQIEDELKKIREIIEEQPGICKREISQKLKISEKMILYYIKDLEGEGLIETRLAGQKKHCYLKGRAPKMVLASSVKKMFDVIKGEPGIDIVSAQKKADVSTNGYRYVAFLESLGLVYTKKDGHKIRVYPLSNINLVETNILLAQKKERLILSWEEIEILMIPGNNIEEISSNSEKGGGYIRIRLNSIFKKLGVATIQEARLLLDFSEESELIKTPIGR